MRNFININFNKPVFILATVFLVFISVCGYCKNDFNRELSAITSKKSVILISNVQTGKLIGVSNPNLSHQKYTIGSLAKIITATALLEENIITTEQTYNCKGYEIINGKKIYCWNPNGHGKNNIETALAQSCNLFFLNYSKKLKSEDILKYYKLYKIDDSEINLPKSGLNTNLALGVDQKLLVSPMGMLSMASTLAGAKKLDISPSTLSRIKNGMILGAKEGTSKLFYKKGYSVAAKTGTAPYGKSGKHGWVIGYYPANNPKIAFCVFIMDGTGFSDAVPVAVRALDLCKKYNYI